MAIYTETINTTRYAPPESCEVKGYWIDGYDRMMTLGQLVAAVSVRTAAACEARTTLELNRLAGNTVFLEALTNAVTMIADEDDATWNTPMRLPERYTCRSAMFEADPTLKNFVVYECKVDAAALPAELASIKDRLDAYAQVKPVLEQQTRDDQMLMISVQSTISNRDVAISTSANGIKGIIGSMLNAAGALR